MKYIFLILGFILIETNCNAEYHKRVQISMLVPTLFQAKIASSAINLLIEVPDKWTDEDKNFKKNSDVKYFQAIGTTSYRVTATFLFKAATTAQTFFNFLKEDITAGTHGEMSIHDCPVEGEAPNDWQGCAQDKRANYQEFVW